MKKLEIILVIILVAAAIINLFDITGMSFFLTIGSCALAFLYLLNGIIGIGKLGIHLVVTRPAVNKQQEPFDSIFPEKQTAYSSFFHPLNWKEKIAVLVTGYCFAIMVLGILFSINYWVASSLMLLMGISQLAILLIVYTAKQIIKPTSFSRQVLLRTVLYFSIGLGLYILPETFMIGIKYRNNPEKLEQRIESHFKQPQA